MNEAKNKQTKTKSTCIVTNTLEAFCIFEISFAFLDNGVTLLQAALKHTHTTEEIRLGISAFI